MEGRHMDKYKKAVADTWTDINLRSRNSGNVFSNLKIIMLRN